ncbi:MAG: AAA family ATPase, partial [Bacilli bacterium]|nr:AAA family ATPase [Bacilli bacterium]
MDIKRVRQIYKTTLAMLDQALIGQEMAKKVIVSALLCDLNSKLLLIGNTGMGKTSLTNFLASSFNKQRITVTSDLIPSDIQTQLMNAQDMQFLQIDEFNRASGKLQSAFLELFAEKQMTVNGKRYSFKDFYVFATQNSADSAGIFTVPQAVYDRFDAAIYLDNLTAEEKRRVLFSGFEPARQSDISQVDLMIAKLAVDNFALDEDDADFMMKVFGIIDNQEINGQKMFAGSNIRAHKYALKLAKLSALTNVRNYLAPSDIVDFIYSLYIHRVDQNVAKFHEKSVEQAFQSMQGQ